MIVYILESFDIDYNSEIEGVFSTRCKATAHEYKCSNDPTYAECSFMILEEEVDAFCGE